ncbi:MAG: c-type cytochrome [Longimicrobiales bacterium]
MNLSRLALSLVFVAALALPLSAQASRTSTRDRVYTAAQADRGQDVFLTVCASCHTRGQFSDGTWRRKWDGRSVFEVLESIRMTMPNDNPGGLSDKEYVDVITYLLELNDYPSGEHDATEASLKRVLVQPPSDTSAASMR